MAQVAAKWRLSGGSLYQKGYWYWFWLIAVVSKCNGSSVLSIVLKPGIVFIIWYLVCFMCNCWLWIATRLLRISRNLIEMQYCQSFAALCIVRLCDCIMQCCCIMLQGKTTNVHDQLKFTKLIDESSTNTSPAWKDNFLVTVYLTFWILIPRSHSQSLSLSLCLEWYNVS